MNLDLKEYIGRKKRKRKILWRCDRSIKLFPKKNFGYFLLIVIRIRIYNNKKRKIASGCRWSRSKDHDLVRSSTRKVNNNQTQSMHQ